MLKILMIAAVSAFSASAVAQAPPGTSGGQDGNAADQALEDVIEAIVHNSELSPSGNPDRDFVTSMLAHEEGARDLLDVELQYGTSPQLRALTKAMRAAHEVTIAKLKLRLRKKP